MKLASCDNCAHRKDVRGSGGLGHPESDACSLSLAPPEGEFLCHRDTMTTTFRDEVVEFARKEYERDFNQAMVEISIMKAERAKGFAG